MPGLVVCFHANTVLTVQATISQFPFAILLDRINLAQHSPSWKPQKSSRSYHVILRSAILASACSSKLMGATSL